MATHYIKKCSCGAVISQCRCPDPNKRVEVIQHGCDACHKAYGKGDKCDDLKELTRPQYQPDLLCFLYILLRDHLTFGAVEEIMEKHVELTRDKPRDYMAGHMEEYAQSLIERLIQ